MMTTIISGVKVVDNRDNRTAVLGDKNSKCKTVIVFYDDPKENEVKGRSISYSTIKKHFSEIEIAEEEIVEEVTETVEEEPAAVEIEDGIEVAEFEDEEEVVEVKEKKERKKRGTVKKSFEELQALLPDIQENVQFVRMKDNSVSVKFGNKRLFRFAEIGDEYMFRADRIANLENIIGVKIIEKKSGKKFAEVRSKDIETVVAKIMENVVANGIVA